MVDRTNLGDLCSSAHYVNGTGYVVQTALNQSDRLIFYVLVKAE